MILNIYGGLTKLWMFTYIADICWIYMLIFCTNSNLGSGIVSLEEIQYGGRQSSYQISKNQRSPRKISLITPGESTKLKPNHSLYI